MSWMYRLSEVYRNNAHRVGEFDTRFGRSFTLMPIAHVTQNAQLEIILKRDGSFARAKVLPKEASSTIVPATLDSANRSGSKIAPHYVHDKLFYVAKDYKKYGSNSKRDANFDAYATQMKHWADHPNSPEKIKIINTYIQQGNVIKDLIDNQFIFTEVDGTVIEKWTAQHDKQLGIEKPPLYKEATGTIFDTTVRFDVIEAYPDELPIWKDPLIFNAFITYIRERMENNEKLIASDPKEYPRGLCYVSGKEELLTSQHGSKLRNAGDMSKIISSNDTSGYTYRGKFKEPTEAAQISYEVSQQAHQALRWLIQKQGTYVDSRYFVTFGVGEPQSISPHEGTLSFFDQPPESKTNQTEELAAIQIHQAIHGLANNICGFLDHPIITIALDAATSGRLAIVYYQELSPELYLDGLIHWHTFCRWQLFYKEQQTKKIKTYVGTPSSFELAKAVYGDQSNAVIKKEFYTRILPSILEKRPIPKDMIRNIYHRVIQPLSFVGTMESWEQTMRMACAMLNYNQKEERYVAGLQHENEQRDYLFGRLLAVAEVFERNILRDGNESRATNATRYFNAFANRPARTWLIIRKQLQPYFNRQGAKATPIQKLMQEIEDMIGPENMTDQALQPLFLIGYSSQVQELYKKKEEKGEDNDIKQ